MAASKGIFQKSGDITIAAGLTSKTLTSVNVYEHGTTWVVELAFTGGPQFIKFNKGLAEVGGTADWGTGTRVL